MGVTSCTSCLITLKEDFSKLHIFGEFYTLCTIFTILLTLWNSEQKNEPLINIDVYYNFTKFHQNRMKIKKVFVYIPFFCSEFQSVSRIVKIVHSAE